MTSYDLTKAQRGRDMLCELINCHLRGAAFDASTEALAILDAELARMNRAMGPVDAAAASDWHVVSDASHGRDYGAAFKVKRHADGSIEVVSVRYDDADATATVLAVSPDARSLPPYAYDDDYPAKGFFIVPEDDKAE